MTGTPVRALIVGAGAIAHAHAQAIRAYTVDGAPAAEIVGVVDSRIEGAEAFGGHWGIARRYSSLEEALSDGGIDVAHICTPPGIHSEQTVAALEAGLDVVLEKPPALSLEQLDVMIATAERTGRQLAVVFQQRTGTASEHVRRLLLSGELGRPLVASCQTLWYRDDAYYEVPWRGTWASEGGGTTLGHGIHQIDLLAYLLGPWSSVQGQLWRLARDVETEDVSTAVVVFDSGVVASLITSVLSPRQASTIRIDTELATVTLEHLYGHGHENWTITPLPGAEAPSSWAFPEVEVPSSHDALIDDIYDALRAGDPLPDVAAAPARSFELVAALYASAATGAPVTPARLRADPSRLASLAAPVTVLGDGRG